MGEGVCEALTRTRYLGRRTRPLPRRGSTAGWRLFAAATRRSVADAAAFEERIEVLEALARTPRTRSGQLCGRSFAAPSGAPILTVASAAELIGRSTQAANEAITRMVGAKVLSQTTVGRRNRAFEAAEVIRAFTDLERQLASPTGDTRIAPPARTVDVETDWRPGAKPSL